MQWVYFLPKITYSVVIVKTCQFWINIYFDFNDDVSASTLHLVETNNFEFAIDPKIMG